MTIDEAIRHAEDVADEQKKLYGLCLSKYNCDGKSHCSALKNGKNKGCLKCADEHRQLAEWLKDYKRLKEQEPKTEKIIKMRDATPEEQEAIDKYIKSISNPTGIEFDEEQEQIDFVRPHKRIPVTLTISGYDRLIDLANAIENDDSSYWTNKKISSALRNILSIKPRKTGQ